MITNEQILAIEESIGVVWPIEPDEITLMMHAAYKLGAEETIDECCKAICWDCEHPERRGVAYRDDIGNWWHGDRDIAICDAFDIREHFHQREQEKVNTECTIKVTPTLLGPDEWHLTQAGKVSEMYTKDGGTTK